jgi:secreted Zn-dependent insulinase-like peptidase
MRIQSSKFDADYLEHRINAFLQNIVEEGYFDGKEQELETTKEGLIN